MVHITNYTVTFKNSNKNNFNDDSIPKIIEIGGTLYSIDDKTKKWILSNNYKSKSNEERFFYIKDFKSFISMTNLTKEPPFDKIRGWAAEKGIYEKGDPKTQYIKLQEEAGEFAKALLKNDRAEMKDAIGDMVVVLVNLAHLCNFKIEDCIESAYFEIKNRKGKMENGTFIKNN